MAPQIRPVSAAPTGFRARPAVAIRNAAPADVHPVDTAPPRIADFARLRLARALNSPRRFSCAAAS